MLDVSVQQAYLILLPALALMYISPEPFDIK